MKSFFVNTIHTLFKFILFEKILILLIKTFPKGKLLKKMAPQNTQYKESEFKICTRYGIKYKLYPRDYQSWLLYFYIDWDSSFGILNYVKENYTIIDVGGNIGQTALMMAKKTKGQIISFEPFFDTYVKFKDNLNLNPDIKNITLNNIGLGDENKTANMIIACKTNSGGNKISENTVTKTNENSVTIFTLDSYLETQKDIALPKIDLIKIDVEGYEMKVLDGCKKTIEIYKPSFFIEINENNLIANNSSAQEIFTFFKLRGYAIFDTLSNSAIESFKELQSDSKDIFCQPIASFR